MFEPRLRVSARLHFLLKTNQWECPCTVKGKRTLDMLLFRINLFNCLFSLALFKYSTLLRIPSPRCYIPSLGQCSHPGSVNSASWCALSNSSAKHNASGQHIPLEEGEGSRGHNGGLIGGWFIRLEQSN